jgi:hypothetical protein
MCLMVTKLAGALAWGCNTHRPGRPYPSRVNQTLASCHLQLHAIALPEEDEPLDRILVKC